MATKYLSAATLDQLQDDFDARETTLRQVVSDRLGAKPPPRVPDHVVASYYFAFRTTTLEHAVADISYHATSGIKNPPKGSLLEQCSARQAGVDPFDATGRIGLLHVAFPLKMMRQGDGHVSSCDLLHTVAGAVIFDFYEHRDARLIGLEVPDEVLRDLPGPGVRSARRPRATGFSADQPAFGTILKPTAGITPDDVERLVAEVAGHPALDVHQGGRGPLPEPRLFAGRRADPPRRGGDPARQGQRGGLGLIFSPHVSGRPARDPRYGQRRARGRRHGRHVQRDLRRRDRPDGPRGHQGSARPARHLRPQRRHWRQDPVDLARGHRLPRAARRHRLSPDGPAPPRQTPDPPFGAEWLASEDALTRPIAGHQAHHDHPRRALDQGNLILNLQELETRGNAQNVMFLAGSAINSIKNAQGRYDPRVGLEAMVQAIEVHRSGELRDTPMEKHLEELMALAERKKLTALREALRQRYPTE